MTAFTLSFLDGTTLSIDGPSVTLARPGGEAALVQPFESVAVAMVAFEANAAAFERRGDRGRATCPDELPGALADLGDDDDRTWIRVDGERLAAVHVYDADPVGYVDGLHPCVLDAPDFGAFLPDDAAYEVLGLHALRRLLAHPAMPACPRFGIEAEGRYIDPLLDRLVESGHAEWLTHLSLYDPWDGNHGTYSARRRALGAELSGLRTLYMPAWAWPLWSAASFARVDRLTLGRGPMWVAGGKAWPVEVPLEELLDGIRERVPGVRQLAFQHRVWTRDDITTLTSHPVVRQLATLELFNIHHAFDHEALLDSRASLAHIERIVVGSHLVSPEVMGRVGDWPAIAFASYDRRELVEDDGE